MMSFALMTTLIELNVAKSRKSPSSGAWKDMYLTALKSVEARQEESERLLLSLAMEGEGMRLWSLRIHCWRLTSGYLVEVAEEVHFLLLAL